ncbi:hypothetical protein [Pseudomonas sp.]|uniref:hypothetical protein n=1 Tax=Pseudomonas sp. TaxID=306 RepID=UPI00260AFDEB|nr:hypothetical protein [Pseudomonas sp.]
MAEYTIRIKDIDGGIGISLEGAGETGSKAGMMALTLVLQAKRAAKLARKNNGPEGCNCPICQAARGSAEIPPGTTIH